MEWYILLVLIRGNNNASEIMMIKERRMSAFWEGGRVAFLHKNSHANVNPE